MRIYPAREILFRLLLLGLLISVLNLAVRPRQVKLAWHAVNVSFPSGNQGMMNPRLAYNRLHFLAQAMPWRTDLWHAAGIYALWAGDWEIGLDHLARIDFQGLDAEEWLWVGNAYINTNQFEAAEAAYNQSLSISESIEVYQQMYAMHSLLKNHEAVSVDLTALTRLDPKNSELAYLLAVHLASQNPIEALEWIKRAAELDGIDLSSLLNLERKLMVATLADSPAVQALIAGQGLADMGEWELAKAAFERSTKLEPGYAEAWAFLGEARQRIDPPEPEAALDDLQNAIRMNPDSVSAITMLALFRQRQGEIQKAQDLFRTAAILEPQNPAWYAAMGSLAGIQGELKDAEWYYRYAVDLAPQQSLYYNLLANFYIRNQIQIQEKALPAATKAVEIEPNNLENLNTLAQVYLLLDDQAQAMKILQSAVQLDPQFAKAHYTLGMTYLFQGQTELAYNHLLQARKTAQDSATLEQAQRALSYYFP
jgi:tetratricopeptide (TPR) repeat protein